MTDATVQALSVLRQTDNMQWYVVPLLILVAYVYSVEIKQKNWGTVCMGISLWGSQYLLDIFNSLVLHFTGRAPLWCTPFKSAFVIYVGVNIEITLLFAIGGIVIINALPEDKNLKILGVPNRILLPIAFGLGATFIEVLLNRCNLLIWDWWFWNWPNIYLIVITYSTGLYFFVWCHDNLSLKAKARMAVIIPAVAFVCHMIFAVVLKWA